MLRSASGSHRSNIISKNNNHSTPADDDAYFLDSYSHSKYYPHEGNFSITTSVTIHVTPEHYHLFSWAVLWAGFLFAILFASYQVRMENRWFASKKRDDDLWLEHHQHQHQRSSTSSRRSTKYYNNSSYNNSSYNNNNNTNTNIIVPEGEGGISSADWTRSRVSHKKEQQ